MTRQARFQRALDDATSSSVASPVPLFLVLVLTSLVHLVSSVDLGFTNLGLRLTLAAVAAIPVLITAVIVHSLTIPALVRPWVVLSSYLVAGAIRGALLDYGLHATGLVASDNSNYRIASGLVITAVVICLVSYSWLALRRAKESLRTVESRYRELRTVLQKLEATSAEQVEKWSLDLVEEIRLQLDELDDIAPDEAQRELSRLVEEVIRPLSQQYAQAVRTWESDPVDFSPTGKVQFWRNIQLLPTVPKVVPPILLISVASIPSLTSLFSLMTAVEMIALVGLAFYGSFKLCFSSLGVELINRAVRLREVVLTFAIAISSIAPAAVSVFVLRNYPDPYAYVIPILAVTPVFSWVIVIGNAARERLHKLTYELSAANTQLEWSIARLNLLSWYQNGAKSRLLHGPIQNSVQVALLRLRTSDDNRGAILQEAKSRIGQALVAHFSSTSAEDEVQALKDVVSTWAHLANVVISIDDSTLGVLKKDLPALAILVDIIQELCSNAIRHGNAKEIRVSASLGIDVLFLRISEDGLNFSQSGGGLGLVLIESCSTKWERTRIDEMNRLEISLPLVRSADYLHKE